MKFQLERIALFSDAVFAIAITLMIIEIKPPHLEHNISFNDALIELSKMAPIFFGTILSFFLIGLFWKNHHAMMKHMISYNSKIISLNAGLLISVAFIPFSTSFVFKNASSGSPLPILIYNLNYIIATFLNFRLFKYIMDPQNNICSEYDTGAILQKKNEVIVQISIYCLVAGISFFSPAAYMGYAAFAFVDKLSGAKKKNVLHLKSEEKKTSDIQKKDEITSEPISENK